MNALTYHPLMNAFVLRDMPRPAPGPGDVLIRVEACGLNPVDAKIGLWGREVAGMDENWVPGLDVSGVIVESGDDVTGWQAGDRVLVHGNMFRPHGGLAGFTVQDASALVHHPECDSATAAATPCAAWTAWRALVDKMHIEGHQSILITGGSGGVGGFAIQIAQHYGLQTVIATSSARNAEYVLGLGASHHIDYQVEDVTARTLQITGGAGVELGLDTVGPDNDILVANSLAFEGQMVELVDVLRPGEYEDAFMKGLSFHQLTLGGGHRAGKAAKRELVEAGTRVSKLLEKGEMKVPRLKTIDLDDAGEALVELLQQRTVGKIVVKM